jgi:hypothetical protein
MFVFNIAWQQYQRWFVVESGKCPTKMLLSSPFFRRVLKQECLGESWVGSIESRIARPENAPIPSQQQKYTKATKTELYYWRFVAHTWRECKFLTPWSPKFPVDIMRSSITTWVPDANYIHGSFKIVRVRISSLYSVPSDEEQKQTNRDATKNQTEDFHGTCKGAVSSLSLS